MDERVMDIKEMWQEQIARLIRNDALFNQVRRFQELRQIALDAQPMREQRLRDRPAPTDTIRIGSKYGKESERQPSGDGDADRSAEAGAETGGRGRA